MMAPLLLASAAFLITVPWGGWVARELIRRGIGKHIREDEPEAHRVKSGTATMGGLYFLAALTVITLGLAVAGRPEGLPALFVMLLYGLLGAFDDLKGLRDRTGVGWLARWKFIFQWLLALGAALFVWFVAYSHALFLPFSGNAFYLGLWYIPLVALLVVFFSNAVNLTDGLDGLAGGASAIAFVAYGVLSYLQSQEGLAFFCFALGGVLLAFLWFNVHPARMFMGDTGSQALGAGLAVVATLSGQVLLLPLIGIIFVAEALSVMMQVSYFKYTKRKYGEGRRIFRMSPLHYHFELGGWSEVQITLRAWIVGLIAAILGVMVGLG